MYTQLQDLPCLMTGSSLTHLCAHSLKCAQLQHRPPGHHLVLVSVGEWMMKFWVSGSYVAVVSNPRTKVPWPSSVCAYVPMISSFCAIGSHLACCSGEPWDINAGMNICSYRAAHAQQLQTVLVGADMSFGSCSMPWLLATMCL